MHTVKVTFLITAFICAFGVTAAHGQLSDSEFVARIYDRTDTFENTRMIYVETPEFLYSEAAQASCKMVFICVVSPKATVSGISFFNWTNKRPQIEITSAKLLVDGDINDVEISDSQRGVNANGANEEIVELFFTIQTLKIIVQASTVQIKLYGRINSLIYTIDQRQRKYLNLFLNYLVQNGISK